MSDEEIRLYLEAKNWEVDALDGVMDILNMSDQIISANYDSKTGNMSLITQDNVFTFKWKLKNYEKFELNRNHL